MLLCTQALIVYVSGGECDELDFVGEVDHASAVMAGTKSMEEQGLHRDFLSKFCRECERTPIESPIYWGVVSGILALVRIIGALCSTRYSSLSSTRNVPLFGRCRDHVLSVGQRAKVGIRKRAIPASRISG